MNELVKQSGLIIILIGVLLLIIPMVIGSLNNKILMWSLVIILVGLLEYIAVNHFVED